MEKMSLRCLAEHLAHAQQLLYPGYTMFLFSISKALTHMHRYTHICCNNENAVIYSYVLARQMFILT